MPISIDNDDELPGWEPGGAYFNVVPALRAQYFGVAKIGLDCQLKWFREVPLPRENPNDNGAKWPIYSVAGGAAYLGGVTFGIFSYLDSAHYGRNERFLFLYRYNKDGEQVEAVELEEQNFARFGNGNDLVIDSAGRTWWSAFPTRAGFLTNLAQFWRTPPVA